MKKFKKALKLLVLVCLITLAGVGIGISGGIPVPSSNKRRETQKDNIELLKDTEGKAVSKKDQIKS